MKLVSMVSYAFITVSFYLNFSLNAQRVELDSVASVLSFQHGNSAYESLDFLTKEYDRIDTRLSLHYAKQFVALASTLNDSMKMIHAGSRLVAAYWGNEMYDSALLKATDLMPVADKLGSSRYIKFLLGCIGSIYTTLGDYSPAMQYLFESHRVRLIDNMPNDLGISYNNIGFLFYKMKLYNKALGYFKQSMNYLSQGGDSTEYELVLINQGLCYVYLDSLEEAEEIFLQALKSCESKKLIYRKASAFYGMGLVNFNKKKWEDANHDFMQSYHIALEFKDNRIKAENLIFLVRLNLASGSLDEGIKLIFEAKRLAQEFGYNEMLLAIYEILINSPVSNYFGSEEVAEIQHNYIQLKEELYEIRISEELAILEAAHIERENLAKINYQTDLLVLEENLKRNQNHAIILISILILILIFVLISSYRLFSWRSSLTKRFNDAVYRRELFLLDKINEASNLSHQYKSKIDRITSTGIKMLNPAGDINSSLDQTSIRIYETSQSLIKDLQAIADSSRSVSNN